MDAGIFEINSSIFKILLVLFSIWLSKVKAAENGKISAVIAFGDSILDTGINNYLQTLSKCNFYPYGRDFVSRRPIGRFSNGRVPSDLVAEGLGIKNLLPAYRNPFQQSSDLLTGVSFASGSSGLDPISARLQGVIWVPDQLNDFKQYIGRLNGVVGDQERTKAIIANAVYLVSAGNNDLAITYFSTASRIYQYNVFSYTNLMVIWTRSFLKNLYDLGARKFAVLGTLPLGCLPGARNSAGGFLKFCVENVNGAARLFNSKLSAELNNLNASLPGAQFVYVDMYNPLLDLIRNSLRSGFFAAADPCCCTPATPTPCLDASRHVFWDYGHPTEKSYRIVLSPIIQQLRSNFV